MTNKNRANDIFNAAISYANKAPKLQWANNARDFVWLAQCTDEERRDALRMLDDRFAAVST